MSQFSENANVTFKWNERMITSSCLKEIFVNV